MRSKKFALRVAGTVFAIVAVLHLLRLVTGVAFILADWTVPMWVNFMGLIATACLSAWLWWLAGSAGRQL